MEGRFEVNFAKSTYFGASYYFFLNTAESFMEKMLVNDITRAFFWNEKDEL